MLFYAQKMPKKDLFAHASQYCTSTSTKAEQLAEKQASRACQAAVCTHKSIYYYPLIGLLLCMAFPLIPGEMEEGVDLVVGELPQRRPLLSSRCGRGSSASRLPSSRRGLVLVAVAAEHSAPLRDRSARGAATVAVARWPEVGRNRRESARTCCSSRAAGRSCPSSPQHLPWPCHQRVCRFP
jgi:hypothetical protein